MSNATHSFGLCMYGIQYLTGAAGYGTELQNPAPLTAEQFMTLSTELGMNTLEVPFRYISPEMHDQALAAYLTAARERGMNVVIAGPNVNEADDLEEQLRRTAKMGVSVFRCIMSRLLRGDREPMGGYDGWQRHVDGTIRKLAAVAPVAEDLGVRVGVENHQDADSVDLLRICETVASPSIGITLDAGNPLAVGEDPVEFATALLPHLVDIHLKDYRMILTEEGYRLVHCAIGDGVVDFPALWTLFDSRPEVPRSIEMASLNERHVRLLTDEWWAGHAKRDARTLVPVLRIMRDRGEPDDPDGWQTPIEIGRVDGAVRWETERLYRSVENLAAIEAGARA